MKRAVVAIAALVASSAPLAPAAAQTAIAIASGPGRASATVTVGLGASVRLGSLAFRPVRVVEDSRCPRLVTCVWRGRLLVELQTAGHGRLVLEDGKPLAIGGGTLTLVGATPASQRGERPPPGAYRLTFRWQR